MEIHSAIDRPSRKGPADYFTGTVWLDPIIEAPAPARRRGLTAGAEPGARDDWHTPAGGRSRDVVAGSGRVQGMGGPVRESRPGDTVWHAPGETHWHGAGPEHAMVHFAFQEALEGNAVAWLEQVTDAEYGVAPEG